MRVPQDPPIASLFCYDAVRARFVPGTLPAGHELLAFLREHLRLPQDTTSMKDNADALDAGLCGLTAVDFLRGNAMAPQDLQKARKEGWIGVRG